MAVASLPLVDASRPKLVAPFWHTALLVALFLALTVGGALFRRQIAAAPETVRPHPHVAPLYLSLMAAEWGLFFYVWRGGLRRTGIRLRDLIGGRWSRPRDVLVDTVFAAGLWACWVGIDAAWGRLWPTHQPSSVGHLLPRGVLETVLWIGLSISAGICEETVFRGYFQAQFRALIRSGWAAVPLQAALFGISHGYQGVTACLKIFVFGLLFGAFAVWRRSLRPGMIAHAWTDIAAGTIGA